MWKCQIIERMNSDIVKLTYREGKSLGLKMVKVVRRTFRVWNVPPNMRVSGGHCLMVTWNMVPFSKGEANSRAHGLNHAWITELMTLDFWKKKKREEKVGRGSMLVRSDRRSSFDLPKNNNRGVMGIKGLCKRHNDHRPSEPSSLTLTPFLIACTFESPHFPWINTMISKMLVSGNRTQVKCIFRH